MYKPVNSEDNRQVLRYDPDARFTRKGYAGYKVHRMIDHKYGVILNDLATPGNVQDHVVIPDILRDFRLNFKIIHKYLVEDKGYRDQETLSYADKLGYDIYIPVDRNVNTDKGKFGPEKFKYDREKNIMICPMNKELTLMQYRKDRKRMMFKARTSDCNNCSVKHKCTKSKNGRTTLILENDILLREIAGKRGTPKYKTLMTKRRIFSEGSFGEAKTLHGMETAKLRGLENMNIQCLLTSIVQNIKKLVKYTKKPKMITGRMAKIEEVWPVIANASQYTASLFLGEVILWI